MDLVSFGVEFRKKPFEWSAMARVCPLAERPARHLPNSSVPTACFAVLSENGSLGSSSEITCMVATLFCLPRKSVHSRRHQVVVMQTAENGNGDDLVRVAANLP